MKIYIGVKELDVMPQDVSMHDNNLRFSDVVQDEYSTDVELPRTQNNTNLLDAFGVSDGAFSGFGKRINCTIQTDGMLAPVDGYLRVTNIGRDVVTATMYMSRFPLDFVDVKISELLRGDDDDIVKAGYGRGYPGTHRTQPTSIQNVQIYNFDHGDGRTDPKKAPMQPSVKVDYVLAKIGEATGFTMPTTSSNMALILPKRYLSPHSTHQIVQMRTPYEGSIPCVYGSRHVTNDMDETMTEGYERIMTFNRDCVVDISIVTNPMLVTDAKYTSNVTVNLMRGGESVDKIEDTFTSHDATSAEWNIQEGDVINFVIRDPYPFGGPEYTYVPIVLEIHDYDVAEDDYKTPAGFVPYYPMKMDGMEYVNDYNREFDYIPVFQNIGDMTIRQFISSLCWKLGKRLSVQGKVLTFVDADNVAKINGNIESVEATDILARNNFIAWAGGSLREGYKFAIDSVFVDEEKNIHESSFYGVGDADGYARVELYKDNGGYIEELQDIKGTPLAEIANIGGYYVLTQPNQLNGLGLQALTKAQVATITTFDDVTNADYVDIEGHRFMVVESDTDMNSGLSTIEALIL